MSCQVCNHQLSAVRGRDNDVKIVKCFGHRLHRQHPRTRGLHILNGGDESRGAKLVGPVALFLGRQQFVASGSRQFIEGRRGLRAQHRYHRVVRKFWHFHRNQLDAHLAQFRQRRVIVFPRVHALLLLQLPQFLLFVAPLLLFGRRPRRFWRGGGPRLFFLRLEVCLQITYTKLFPVRGGAPVESRVLHGAIFSVGTINRVENDGAILHLAADRSKLVHAPRERHGAGPWNETKGRPQAGAATPCGRRCDRSQRFAADAEDHATRGGGRRRSRRRTTRSLRGIPGISGLASVPRITHRQGAKRELRHQHRARSIKPLHNRRIFLDCLLFKTAGSPCRWVTLHRQQILCAPGQAVQRPAIFPRGDLAIHLFGLRTRAFFGQRHNELQRGVVSLQSLQVHVRQRSGAHFFRSHQLAPFPNVCKCQSFEILRHSVCHNVRRCRHVHELLRRLYFHSGKQGVKHQCHVHGVGHVQRVDGLIPIELIVQSRQHHFLLRVGNCHVGDGRGILDQFFGDLFLFLRLSVRPQHSRE